MKNFPVSILPIAFAVGTATSRTALAQDANLDLVELRLTGAGQDGVRFAAKLISKIGYLANGLASGDFKPTNQQLEVQQILAEELRTHLRARLSDVNRPRRAE